MDTFAHATYHVVPHRGRWAVKRSGARRASGVFATKEEAVARAEQLARGVASELVVHARRGADGSGGAARSRRAASAPAE